MWGRFWNNLYKDVVPFPERPSLDVSDAMKEQGYDVKKMFQSADDFYAGMGLKRVNDLFWKNSMLEKPKDGREVVCHATAWDFYDAKVEFKNLESIRLYFSLISEFMHVSIGLSLYYFSRTLGSRCVLETIVKKISLLYITKWDIFNTTCNIAINQLFIGNIFYSLPRIRPWYELD